ncbi:SDR family NAD(P)-dependent oxidoreductase [Clostridium intestinale]|uniref:SDR family NAD(P)-dependent oxidoreductase n=2 Tax=Clostridium TaxID=1485 RepID=UPI002DD66973|nr:SDR family NAD(P)-dependent oxidoreductase [Clostridium intestinale]
MLRLENKVALVTGASQGIGRSIAESFAEEGATVIGIDINKLPYENKNIYGYEVNVVDRAGIKSFFDSITEKFGKVDILVNNAGITRDALIQKMTEEM